MTGRKRGRMVFITSGSTEGVDWNLRLAITEKTKSFSGSFSVEGEQRKQKRLVRSSDRCFFKARLSKKYLSDKVLHHSWIENSSEYIKVILLDKSEHPNGGKDVLTDRKLWMEKENWL